MCPSADSHAASGGRICEAAAAKTHSESQGPLWTKRRLSHTGNLCFGTTMPSTCRRATETTQLPKHMHVKHFIAYCARNIIIRTTRASQGKQKKRWYGLCLWETSTVNGVLRIVHVTGTYVKRCPTVQEALFNPFLILQWLWSNRWKTLRTQFLERFRT